MIKIIPAILTNDSAELLKMLKQCEGIVDRVQIDIIDGVFADNKTIDPSLFADIDTDLKIDFHLMTKNPVDWVERCVRGMADRIIGQVEMMENQIEYAGIVQASGVGLGLALDLETPVSAIDPVILNNLDCVLVMSVKAGFGGREFDYGVIDKIKKLDDIRSRNRTPFSIIDDGGIRLNSIDDVRLAGVDEVAIGRKIFDGDLKTNIENFQKAAYK